MSPSLVRSLSLVMVLFFSYAAVVQWNDPDWFTWMFLYSAAACFSLQYGVSSLPIYVSAIFGVVAIMRFALIFFLEVETINSISYIIETELGRELGGCILVAFWMAVMSSTSSASSKKLSKLASTALILSIISVAVISLGYPLWLRGRNVSLEGHCRGTLPTLAELFPKSEL